MFSEYSAVFFNPIKDITNPQTKIRLDICRNTSVDSFLCTVCFQDLDKFSGDLKIVFHVQIFLPTRLVKISFIPKYFQGHREACSISSLSSIVLLFK